MAHPLLESAERNAGGGHSCAEGVAEVVEGHLADLRVAECLLEAPDQVGVIEDGAGVGVREDEVVVALVIGAAVVALDLDRDPVGQRHRPRASLALGSSPVAADVVLADTELARLPIDVAPAQSE